MADTTGRSGRGSPGLRRSYGQRRASRFPWLRAATGGLLLAVTIAVVWQPWGGSRSDLRRVANLAAPGDAVVFFGDSITQGYGVRTEESFLALVGCNLLVVGTQGRRRKLGERRIGNLEIGHMKVGDELFDDEAVSG